MVRSTTSCLKRWARISRAWPALNDRRSLDEALSRIDGLEADARTILAKHEATPERVVTLEQSYENLDSLSIDQDDLFREALRATESGLFRATHVLAWAGFIDFL